MTTATSTTARRMIALDIDGTLLGHDGRVPAETVDALDLVRAAGHEVVLATGRSLVGLLPVATRLGLAQTFAVCSNGTMTVRLDPAVASGYVIDAACRFDAGPVIGRTLTLAPGAWVGVEEVGWGWTVNQVFADGLLNGYQKQVPVADLAATLVTRVAVHSPGIGQHLAALAATGVTVTPAGADWADITAPRTSKAIALERLRHAPQPVHAAADEITGTIQEHGAVTVLHSLLPTHVDTTTLSRLAAQFALAVHTAPDRVAVVRVWHGTRADDLIRCEVGTLQDGAWEKHAPVPAGTGATMRDVETAAREAGLVYPRGSQGRRRAHWRTSVPDIGPAAFELPLSR